jgi:hypothetical protein
LRQGRWPLVVFPEGDVYHLRDRTVRFRPGAAAIALMASRHKDRPVVVLPCAIRFWFVTDPSVSLSAVLEQVERRLRLPPLPGGSLLERVYRVGEAAVSGLEQSEATSGRDVAASPRRCCPARLRRRICRLVSGWLRELERQYPAAEGRRPHGALDRVHLVRQAVIRDAQRALGEQAFDATLARPWSGPLEKLLAITQLLSYPAHYVTAEGPVERLAETIDKLQEDILHVTYPSLHAQRRVQVTIGPPLAVDPQCNVEMLTGQMQQAVQSLLDATGCG